MKKKPVGNSNIICLIIVGVSFVGVVATLIFLCVFLSNTQKKEDAQVGVVTTYDNEGRSLGATAGTDVDITRQGFFKIKSVSVYSQGSAVVSETTQPVTVAWEGLDNKREDTSERVSVPDAAWLKQYVAEHPKEWGKKTLVVRTQNGSLVAIYTGNKIEPGNSDYVRWVTVDGKRLALYNVTYTVVDTPKA